jgi:hypothetical protein
MAKKLNEEAIHNELKTGSVFFRSNADSPNKEVPSQEAPTSPPQSTSQESNIETVQDSHQATQRDAMTPRYHDTTLETIRKAVKRLGKEGATYRFTPEEKKALSELIYTFRGQSIRTSENEIARIALNFIILNYRENKEHSILAQVLEKLND